MTGRNILIVGCAVGSLVLASESYAQPSIQAPLYGRIQDFSKKTLDDALATSERANGHARQDNFFQAVQEYEALLARSQGIPNAMMSYPVLMALAGAHLEAAIDRVMYADRSPALQKSLALREQNQTAINNHISSVYTLVGTAAREAGASGIAGPDKAKFVCGARDKLAAAISLHGIVNSIPGDVDKGIKGYEATESCSPDAKRAIRYLRGMRRDISNSPMSSDSIAKIVSLFVKEIVPHGNLISEFIDLGYDYYKKNRPSVREVLPR